MRPIIRAESVHKQYTIGAAQASYATLRDSLANAFINPFRNGHSKNPDRTIWAVKDVSFEIKPGEAVGIVGHNGAGKSTLLKLLSRITEPTSGSIDLYGRVGSLLEVGTGFHGELTGRENIFLSGAILGMKRSEIERKFDEIVAFAGTGKFLDTPVKHYSSGMYVRLAFAVAAHLEPEILVVDEVLAVGDAAFQRKCLGRMEAAAKTGRTVLFVSHNMGAIQALCSRVIQLHDGAIVRDGDAKSVVAAYLESVSDGFDQSKSLGAKASGLAIERVVLRNDRGEGTTNFKVGESLSIEIHYKAEKRINGPYFWIAVESQFGSLFAANSLLDGVRPEYIEGEGIIAATFTNLSLLPQLYTVHLGVRTEDGTGELVKSSEVGFFKIVGTAEEIGFKGEMAESLLWSACPMFTPYQWELPDGQTVQVRFESGKGFVSNGN